MTDVRTNRGQRGEELAAEHFERLGFEVLARNHRTRFGELDLVAYDGHTLVFAEVKTRRSGAREPWENLHDRQAVQGPPHGDRLAHRGRRPPLTAPTCASTASRSS